MSEVSGISVPLFRTGTKDDLIQEMFVIGSDIIDSYCPWIWKGMSIERSLQFAQQIHKDNKKIEATRFAVYLYDINDMEKTKDCLCDMHVDSHNGKGEDLSQVLIISKMLWEKRTYAVVVSQLFFTQEIL